MTRAGWVLLFLMVAVFLVERVASESWPPDTDVKTCCCGCDTVRHKYGQPFQMVAVYNDTSGAEGCNDALCAGINQCSNMYYVDASDPTFEAGNPFEGSFSTIQDGNCDDSVCCCSTASNVELEAVGSFYSFETGVTGTLCERAEEAYGWLNLAATGSSTARNTMCGILCVLQEKLKNETTSTSSGGSSGGDRLAARSKESQHEQRRSVMRSHLERMSVDATTGQCPPAQGSRSSSSSGPLFSECPVGLEDEDHELIQLTVVATVSCGYLELSLSAAEAKLDCSSFYARGNSGGGSQALPYSTLVIVLAVVFGLLAFAILCLFFILCAFFCAFLLLGTVN